MLNADCMVCYHYVVGNSPEKIKMVRLCAGKLSDIGEQVAHAAITTSRLQQSVFAKENMYLLRDMWLQQVSGGLYFISCHFFRPDMSVVNPFSAKDELTRFGP